MKYEYIESPNKSSRRGNQVGGIVGHFTNGGPMDGTIRYMCNKIKVPKHLQGINSKKYVHINGVTYYNALASSNYVTGRSGRSVMLVPENMAAWHSGSSSTKPRLNGRGSLNLWTIGHEICNWGPLRKNGDKFYSSPQKWEHEYKGPEPIRIIRKLNPELKKKYVLSDNSPAFPEGIVEYWEPYTDEQINSVINLWTDVVGRYDLNKKDVVGHEDVDPTRKSDPGAAFPWNDILSAIFPGNKKTISDLLFSEAPEEDINGNVSEEVHLAERSLYDDRSSYKNNICESFLSKFKL